MKKFILPFFIILAAIPFYSKAYLSRRAWYINKNIGVRTIIPKGWLKAKTNPFTPLKLMLYHPEGGRISIVSTVPGKYVLDKWVAGFFKSSSFRKNKITINSKSKIVVSGKSAFKITGKKSKTSFVSVFFVHKSRGIILSFSCEPKSIYINKNNRYKICASLTKDFSFLLSRTTLF